MTTSGIYMIRHKDSGKMYIGRSTDVQNRWNLHKRHTEERRSRSPLHRAFRKYGYDAFEWKVLVTAPARLHVALERQFMRDWSTMAPSGYNVGGAAGGFAPKELLDAMGPEEREEQLSTMREQASKMHTTVAEKRKDPAYDAWYKTRMSQAAITRWAQRRERLATDPEYAAEAQAKWAARALRARDTIAERKRNDPEFAAKMQAKMERASKKAAALRSAKAAARKKGGS